MKSLSEVEEATDEWHLFVTSVEYEERGGNTVTHVFGRTADGERKHVEVWGHSPKFYVHEDEFHDRLKNHFAVDSVEFDHTSLQGDPLVEVRTHTPQQVGELREMFTRTWEADVFYSTRWLVDSGIYTGTRINAPDLDGQKAQVRFSDVQPSDPPDVSPRMVVADIEVDDRDGFPDHEDAHASILSIAAHDSYDDEYVAWALVDDGVHDDLPDDARAFEDESEMLFDFNEWVSDNSPDILTGWNSDEFDYPYLINRCRELSIWNYQDWSSLGDVFVPDKLYSGPRVKGVNMVDMMPAYEKTQIHELDSKKLDDVAADELDRGKDDIDGGFHEVWSDDLDTFVEYNIRDVEAVVEIDKTVSAIELLTSFREVTGCSYEEAVGNVIDMCDPLVLRRAREQGVVLPTATKPDVSFYHGAFVLRPEAGLHENCVYPDIGAQYPSMGLMNIGPDTIIGTQEEFEASEYDESEVIWSYIDTRDEDVKEQNDVTPEGHMERCYFVAPWVEEGFMKTIIEDLIELTGQHSGKMYEAVKRIRNGASYGFLGDSDTYGTGSRLYDWRVAESITLGARKVLKHTIDEFTDCVDDPDAKAVGADTDGAMVTLPNSETHEDALDMAFDAAEYVEESYEDFVQDEFNARESHLELEVESLSSRVFYPYKQNQDIAAKKRYGYAVVWDDSDGGTWYDPADLRIKGFDYVRSDTADITRQVQKKFLELVLRNPQDEARDAFYEYLNDLVAEIRETESYAQLGRPKGVGQPLSEYGSPDRKPQPTYRGAKYANEFIYEDSVIGEGSKPHLFYLDGMGEGYPSSYHSDTPEDGLKVDAVAVEQPSDLPDEANVDVPTMLEKTVADPLEPLCDPLGWNVEDAIRGDEQVGIKDFM